MIGIRSKLLVNKTVRNIETKSALMLQNSVNKFTKEGRELMHRQQKSVPNWQVQWIREHPIINERARIEFNDNRISLFIVQNEKCAVTGEELILTEMDCHHKNIKKGSMPNKLTR